MAMAYHDFALMTEHISLGNRQRALDFEQRSLDHCWTVSSAMLDEFVNDNDPV